MSYFYFTVVKLLSSGIKADSHSLGFMVGLQNLDIYGFLRRNVYDAEGFSHYHALFRKRIKLWPAQLNLITNVKLAGWKL